MPATQGMFTRVSFTQKKAERDMQNRQEIDLCALCIVIAVFSIIRTPLKSTSEPRSRKGR